MMTSYYLRSSEVGQTFFQAVPCRIYSSTGWEGLVQRPASLLGRGNAAQGYDREECPRYLRNSGSIEMLYSAPLTNTPFAAIRDFCRSTMLICDVVDRATILFSPFCKLACLSPFIQFPSLGKLVSLFF